MEGVSYAFAARKTYDSGLNFVIQCCERASPVIPSLSSLLHRPFMNFACSTRSFGVDWKIEFVWFLSVGAVRS
jgi:hypothetical protein